ncbi:hypothetical protein BpHYR1_025070 [Brachionus plicatilis]|uniref:Uncharacterized protein n=1 Tax=Brachionus plicatilis TaxID=10195 RepID=A0A3M7SEP9_BRAPC|nr:hypothetical protein BpHYR1_025070 [Brachionus plicatilis]
MKIVLVVYQDERFISTYFAMKLSELSLSSFGLIIKIKLLNSCSMSLFKLSNYVDVNTNTTVYNF